MENSYWFKDRKSVITTTMVDHVCFTAHFAARSSCHHWHVPWILLREISLFLCAKMNKERRLFIFFGWKMLLQFYRQALIEVWYIYQLYATAKKMQMVWTLLLSLLCPSKAPWKNKHKRWKCLGFLPIVLSKKTPASADKRSEIQACFQKMTEDFLDANSKTCYGVKILW